MASKGKRTRKRSGQKKQKNEEEKNDEIKMLLEEIKALRAKVEKLEAEKAQATNNATNQMLAQLAETVMQLKQAIEAGTATAAKLISDARGLVIGIANDPKIAKEVGYATGINVSVLQNTAQRILEGKVSDQEIVCFIDNIWNAVKGYFVGDRAYKDVVNDVERAKEKSAEEVMKHIRGEEA